METGANRAVGVAETSQLRIRDAGAQRPANERRAEDSRPREESAAQVQFSERAVEQSQESAQTVSLAAGGGANATPAVSAANQIESPSPGQQSVVADAPPTRGASQVEIGPEARRLAREATVDQADVGNNRSELAASPNREVVEQRLDAGGGGTPVAEVGVSEDELGVVTDAGLNF